MIQREVKGSNRRLTNEDEIGCPVHPLSGFQEIDARKGVPAGGFQDPPGAAVQVGSQPPPAARCGSRRLLWGDPGRP